MKKTKRNAGIVLAALLSIAVGGCVCFKKANLDDMNGRRIQIGWAKRSIAVPGQAGIAGTSNLRVSQGEYTPVLVSALAMSNASDAVIFVSADVVSLRSIVYNTAIEIIKKEAPDIPTEKIIVGATHTHAGPSTMAYVIDYPNKVDVVPSAKSVEFISRQLADAVKEAWAKRKPGSIAYGYGFATTGHSRRSTYLIDISTRYAAAPGFAVNGHGMMYGWTNDDKFAGYEAGTDTFINLLYTFDAKGKLSGAIVNVPCPSQTNESAWVYHASFWHNVREKLAAKYGDAGLICQAAAAGDLSPRQLHYNDAEYRRYQLKYPEKIKAFLNNPMKNPEISKPSAEQEKLNIMEMMRAEDIANRIMDAFDEVLAWAKKDMQYAPVLKHEVKTVELSRCLLTGQIIKQEQENTKKYISVPYMTEGDKWKMLRFNSVLKARRNKVNNIIKRYNEEKTMPGFKTNIHTVRVGDVAFATNRFELFIDYMHRIQGRSPFMQTFIVQLVTDQYGVGSYLATERGELNKGYSATPYSCQVSAKGGQELVEYTLDMLKNIKK